MHVGEYVDSINEYICVVRHHMHVGEWNGGWGWGR